MNVPAPTPPAEPPIAWRCSWAIDPDFVGAYRPQPIQQDFASKEAVEQFKRQLKTDFPRAVASAAPVYLRNAVAPQRGLQ